MTELILIVATALVVTGAVAAAGTAVAQSRAVSAVAAGAVLLVIAESTSLTAGTTSEALAIAGTPLLAALLGIAVLGWRPATAVALTGGLLAGPIRQVLDDPFHDPSCLSSCLPNPLVLFPHPTVADWVQGLGVALLLLGIVAPARHRGTRETVAAVAAVSALLLITGGQSSALLAASSAAALLVGWDLVRATTIRARLAEAVESLAMTADPERVLSEALGGRPVLLGFHVDDGPLLDREGCALQEPPKNWTTVDINGPDGPLARLSADLRGVAPNALAQVLRGPTRLALENNRLAVEAAVRSHEIQASAGRLVELADRGRRRLERDLHDGAQRHVLTLGLAVQADERLPIVVRHDAEGKVRTVLHQLREVAHGIRPPQLDTGGLARGLAVLADRSTVPLEIGPIPEHIDNQTSEACYRLVEEVLRSATGPVSVWAERLAEGGLKVTIDAAEAAGLSAGASDRIRALGGSIHSTNDDRGRQHLAVLPRRVP